ncbi:AraC family transcriptional regulator [Rapidithrix thailandica]|uniref:AraC family transcriptional regulator n=1 Tax=Rapidithrix thailandica TaxID=413964 RepID=A0AAW9SFC7_9BACT
MAKRSSNSISTLPTLGISDMDVTLSSTTGFTLFRHEEKGKSDVPLGHKHDFYLLLFVKSGEGVHNIDFVDYPVQAQQVFFLAPGQVHSWKLKKDTVGFQLMFSPEFLPIPPGKLSFFSNSSSPELPLSDIQSTLLESEFRAIENETHQTDGLSGFLLRHRLWTCLLLLQRWYTEHHAIRIQSAAHRTTHDFMELLEQHYPEQSSVQFYANALHLSSNYLNVICKKELGLTAGEVIRNRLLLEAKRLLTFTQNDIKEIAFQLGFEDAPYFTRFFKKLDGRTPSEFRQNSRIVPASE